MPPLHKNQTFRGDGWFDDALQSVGRYAIPALTLGTVTLDDVKKGEYAPKFDRAPGYIKDSLEKIAELKKGKGGQMEGGAFFGVDHSLAGFRNKRLKEARDEDLLANLKVRNKYFAHIAAYGNSVVEPSLKLQVMIADVSQKIQKMVNAVSAAQSTVDSDPAIFRPNKLDLSPLSVAWNELVRAVNPYLTGPNNQLLSDADTQQLNNMISSQLQAPVQQLRTSIAARGGTPATVINYDILFSANQEAIPKQIEDRWYLPVKYGPERSGINMNVAGPAAGPPPVPFGPAAAPAINPIGPVNEGPDYGPAGPDEGPGAPGTPGPAARMPGPATEQQLRQYGMPPPPGGELGEAIEPMGEMGEDPLNEIQDEQAQLSDRLRDVLRRLRAIDDEEAQRQAAQLRKDATTVQTAFRSFMARKTLRTKQSLVNRAEQLQSTLEEVAQLEPANPNVDVSDLVSIAQDLAEQTGRLVDALNQTDLPSAISPSAAPSLSPSASQSLVLPKTSPTRFERRVSGGPQPSLSPFAASASAISSQAPSMSLTPSKTPSRPQTAATSIPSPIGRSLSVSQLMKNLTPIQRRELLDARKRGDESTMNSIIREAQGDVDVSAETIPRQVLKYKEEPEAPPPSSESQFKRKAKPSAPSASPVVAPSKDLEDWKLRISRVDKNKQKAEFAKLMKEGKERFGIGTPPPKGKKGKGKTDYDGPMEEPMTPRPRPRSVGSARPPHQRRRKLPAESYEGWDDSSNDLFGKPAPMQPKTELMMIENRHMPILNGNKGLPKIYGMEGKLKAMGHYKPSY